MNLAKTLAQSPEQPVELTDAASQAVMEQLNPVIGYINKRWEEARNARVPHETRFIRSYNNFRGSNNSDTSFISTEISKAFIKITKTKTLAAYGQILEVLFSGKTIPLEVKASEVPMGIDEVVHIDPNDPAEAPEQEQPQGPQPPDEAILGYHGDGNDLGPGETITDRALKWVKNKFGMAAKVKSGAGDAPGRIIIQPAKDAAFLMNKRIHDQLGDMKFDVTLRKSVLELCMLGSGVLKGPFNRAMEYPDWDEQGNYAPTMEEIPVITMTSLWNFYPDPQAWNTKQLTWAIERHKLSRPELRDLKKNRSFRPEAIERVITTGIPNYNTESFEDVLEENSKQATPDRYMALEFWGTIDKTMMEASGLSLGFDLPETMQEIPVNVWIVGNEIIRFVLNPLLPVRIPYFICPYELNLYSVFGVGIPENMEDTQLLMNGFMRLAVDNAVLSGSVMLEIDESVLIPGQQYKVETGKIFRKNSGAPNQRAVQSIAITNTSQQNMQMFDTARRLADESTGIPSFSHGLTGVQGVGRTAGGIQMLMGAASQTIKTVIKNIDDFWLEPIGQAMIYWNMQNKFDKNLRGDISAIAKGTSSLMQKEAKAQKLIQFAQVGFANPALAPWINAKEWLKMFGENIEIETDILLNRPDEAKLQAMIMQAAGGIQAQGSPAAPPDQGQQPVAEGAPQQAQQGAQPAPQGVGNVGKSPDQAAGIGTSGPQI